MNIEIKNADGDVVAAAPEMNLYTVADQVHKNEKIDNINKLKEQATDPLYGIEIDNKNDATITEEDAKLVADALLSFSMKDPNNSTNMTEEEIKKLTDTIQQFTEEHPDPATSFPSNNGKEFHEPEEGETKYMQVSINPETGEHIPVGEVAEEDLLGDNETFEDMVERVKNSDIKINDTPLTEEELEGYLKSDKENSIFDDLCKNTDFDPETIKGILEVTNRKMKGEDFNVYKALPEKIKELINSYCRHGSIPLNTPNGNQFRNMVADELINEFVSNISLNRIQTDFSKELEEIFDKGTKELSESIVGYTEERSKAYREAAEKMEDPEKKAKLTAILDRVDEGYNLTELKEYAKTCKIKKYDLERPDKIYRNFLQKYKDSKYNIYGIDMAVPVILRNINKNNIYTEPFDKKDIDAFFIAFCKQTANYNPNENPMDHAYMYYLMYNCIFTDINTGNAQDVSLKFLQNIKDVIINLRERNNNFGK